MSSSRPRSIVKQGERLGARDNVVFGGRVPHNFVERAMLRTRRPSITTGAAGMRSAAGQPASPLRCPRRPMPADLHCHILPNLDDGAVDVADALGMARQAAADGIDVVCATPHIRHDHDVRLAELAGRRDDLNAELSAAGIPVRVERGGEVAQAVALGLADDELAAVALGPGGRWILVEPAPGVLGSELETVVERLGSRGYGSIVAHPERHAGADLVDRLARLIERGALVQLTAALVEEQDWLVDLAALAVVHLLASDAHSSRSGRPLCLSGAFERLAGREEIRPHIEWMRVHAPDAVLHGRPVQPPFAPR
jgi:protein-tyrosine phosphatase